MPSWDIVVNRVGNKLFFDKRQDANIDYVTCMETANDFGDDDSESINHHGKLMNEASYVNQAFSQQVLSQTEGLLEYDNPRGPFVSSAEELPAPVGYKYRKFTLGNAPKHGDEDSRVEVLCRCELDGIVKSKSNDDQTMRVFTLNELDSKLTGGVDWRLKLESQRGAVLATELKNNSNKLARWTLQALLSGADLIKLGFISRKHPKESAHHGVIMTPPVECFVYHPCSPVHSPQSQ